MKKLLYSLLTLAAALTVTSCLKEVEGGAVYDDGTFVDATFSVVLGPQTKAFADGTTVNQLYAGLYEVDSVEPTSFTYVAHTENPIDISEKKAQVSFDGKLKRGKFYAVVFWAQNNEAPYELDWGKNVTTGPSITIGRTGPANDETRDAFTATDVFGAVTAEIVRDENDPVQLMRPFAQVNILVPNANVDETENLVAGDRVSGMTIAGLPNVLNLATGDVSSSDGGQDYDFTDANITEAAFGNFASGYQYMAMNYVPYGADLNANYQVTFSVINKSQTADNKVVNVPLKPNVRTNIVGNIFAEEFNYSAWAVVMPEPGELTSISLAVGTQGESAQNPVVLASVGATASVHPIISRDVTNETPTITVAPASVATASWNNQTGNVDITAQATGTAVITVVFPAVTKTSYAEGSIKLYVSVSGTDPAQKTARNLAFSASSATVTIDADDNIFPTLSGAKIDDVTYSLENVDPADCVTINGSNGAVNLFAAGTATVKATAPETDEYAAGEATYELTVNAAPVQKQDQTLNFAEDAQAATMGVAYTLQEVSGAHTTVTYTSSDTGVATIDGTTVTLVAAGQTTITATATEDETYNAGSASYTLTVNAAPTIQDVTVAQFLAASVSETQQYRLTGIVGGTLNVQYGNFDLTDDTGTVAIYGLFAEEVAYGVSNPGNNILTTLGIEAGDRVTLVGYRGVHNNNPQAVYSYHESHVDALAAPANLEVGTTNDKKITASWDAVAGAASYTLKINDTEIENATSPFTSSSAYEDGSYSVSVKAVGAVAPDSPYSAAEIVSIGSVVSFSWSSSSTTTGYSFTNELGKAVSGYYQDKSASEGLSLLVNKSNNAALFSSNPTSISLTVSVGGGSVKDPLGNSVKAYLVDNQGKSIQSTETTVTTKVETTTGKTYTVSMPIVAEAYGIRITHEKESGYNVRIYSISMTVSL